MKILINASNLKQGGGLQVADSICLMLNNYIQHEFVVVLSSFFPESTKTAIGQYLNIKNVSLYNVKNSLSTLIAGRDKFLDRQVEKFNIDVVLTIFGPSRWNPRCIHLSGFALSFLVMPESPYFQRMTLFQRLKASIRNKIWEIYIRRSTKYFYTENPMISERLEKKFKGAKVYTVTNYYNQVFDQPDKWIDYKIPAFEGITLLNISSPYPHKNLSIAIDIVKAMRLKYPDFKIRFIYTIDKGDMPQLPEDMRDNFLFLGKVNIDECPSLYSQCEIAFQPTLLECFTATYPEAMRMEKPIVTTSMAFAKGLCGKAAVYYSPLAAKEAADRIYEVSTNEVLRQRLVNEGKKQLKTYDTYVDRTAKLIEICESLYKR